MAARMNTEQERSTRPIGGWALWIVGGLLVLLVLIVGFLSGVALWELLQFLIISAAVPLGTLVLQWVKDSREAHEKEIEELRRKHDLEIKEQETQDGVLGDFLDQMEELFLKEELRKAEPNSEAGILARARTLTTLERVGSSRKRSVMRFLKDSKLVEKQSEKASPVVPLYGAGLNRADLSGMNLANTNLSGADLGGGNLNGVNMNGADLNGAMLYGASMSGAKLANADLSAAEDGSSTNLSGALLSNADLSGARLSAVWLAGADLSSARLAGADLSGANLSGATLAYAYTVDVYARQSGEDSPAQSSPPATRDDPPTNLSGAILKGANLVGAVLRNADLSSAALQGADLSYADLIGARLAGADLSGATFFNAYTVDIYTRAAMEAGPAQSPSQDGAPASPSGANLSGANLSGASLSYADLRNTDLSNAKVRGADLSGANLTGVSLAGADLTGSILDHADLSGADLSTAKGLTQQQLEETYGDEAIRIPEHVRPPERWASG